MIHVRILRNIFSGDWENAYIEGPASANAIKAAIGNMDSPIYFNGCLLDDNDIVPDNSFLILKIIPQGVATGLFVASLVTIIAFGVSAIFIINALSSIPSAKKLQSSPSLRGSTNSARKGQMLPILLGKYRVYPDVAALPYSIYNNDKQSLVQMFCFGYSNVSIDTDTLKIGETPLSKYKEAYYSTNPSEYSMRCIETNIGLCLQNDGTSSPIERRTASNTWKIAVGIIAPSGIHEYDGDSKKSATISIRISYKESSSQSWIIAHDRMLSLNKDTYRESFEIIPPYTGTYDVKVERTNKESESSSVIDTIYLDVLQSWTEDDNGSKAPIINKTAFRLLELKLQATDQLNGIVDELNAICTLKTWDYIGTGTGKSAWILRETQNPASMILYLLTNQMANPSPLSEDQIAWDEFEAFYLYCKEKGFECNAYINSEDYSISDLCNYIAQSNLAQIRKAGLKTGIIIDQESDHIVQMFTPRNAWGFSMKKAMTINDQYLKIKYVDASIGYEETERSIMLSEDGSTVIDIKDTTEFDGREISLVGVTSPDHAAIVGRQKLLELAHRKRTFSWNCDLEGILCTPGDVILFEHNQFSIGLGEARIKEAITAGEYTIALILDEILPFKQGKTYGFTIRKNYMISESVEIAKTAGNRIDLKIPSSFAFDNGDLIAIGELSKETIKLMVTSIERDSSENCTITATDYAEEIYREGTIPPYDPGISIYPEGGDIGTGANLPGNYVPGAKPGADAPIPIIDYQYSDSDRTPPNKFYPFVFGGGLVHFKGGLLGDNNAKDWEKNPSKTGKYKWMRVSTDGGKTFTYSPITGPEPSFFELFSSKDSFALNSRGVVDKEEKLSFWIKKHNMMPSDLPTWSIYPESLMTSDMNLHRDSIDVIIPKGFENEYLIVSVSIGTFGDVLSKQIYGEKLGISTAQRLKTIDRTIDPPEPFPTTLPDGISPIMDGDYLLVRLSDNGKSYLVPYRYSETINPSTGEIEGWVPSSSVYPNHSEIMGSVLQEVLASSQTTPSVSAMYGFFQSLVANDAFIKFLCAQFLEITGAIYGGGYDKLGNNSNSNQGFYISSNGLLVSSKGQFNEAQITGTFSCSDEYGNIMHTAKAETGITFSFEKASRWKFSDFRNMVSFGNQGIAITYDSKNLTAFRFEYSLDLYTNSANYNEKSDDTSAVVPYDGIYTIIYTVYGTRSELELKVNGNTRIKIAPNNESEEAYNKQENLTLKAGDTISIHAETKAVSPLGGDPQRVIYLLRPDYTSIYFKDNTNNIAFARFLDSEEYYIEKVLTCNGFDSSSLKLYAAADAVFSLEHQSYMYPVATGNKISYNGNEMIVSYVSHDATNIEIIFGSGHIARLEKADRSEFATAGWYDISGSITLMNTLRGMLVQSIFPNQDPGGQGGSTTIGAPDRPFGAVHATYSKIKTIESDNFTGNVNSESTRETYKVWGAVAN